MENSEGSVLDQVKEMWKVDCKINEGNLAQEIANVPLLHCKYVSLLADMKKALKRANNKYLRMQKAKMKYYKGEMTREDLVKYGWDQYQGNKVLKTEMHDVLKLDDDMIEIDDEVHDIAVTVQTLESIMKEINSRNYSLKTMVDWTKMMNGLN
jgi:hypothetical protein